jgi:hypothetical protein
MKRTTGKQTNIAVSRKFINRLPEPYSNCIEELTEEVSQKNYILLEMYNQKQIGQIKNYQQQYCLKICQQYYYVEQCECYSFELAFLEISSLQNKTNSTGCYQNFQIFCLQNAEIEFANSEAINLCYSQCPQQCSEADYELNVNYADFPSEYYLILNNDYGEPINSAVEAEQLTTFKQSISFINVYYSSFTYTSIDQSPLMTIDDLIANVGGAMILFTGASVLALIEFLEYKLSILIKFFSLKIFD